MLEACENILYQISIKFMSLVTDLTLTQKQQLYVLKYIRSECKKKRIMKIRNEPKGKPNSAWHIVPPWEVKNAYKI
jgi:hypothetical protein